MLAQLKRLGSETVVYGTSTIVGRFLNFLLVPLYTNVLRPDQYGIITYVYSIMAFVNVIYSYGMESAYFKYSSTLEIGTGRENFTTPFSSLFASSLFFSWAIAGFASPVAGAMSLPPEYGRIVYYMAAILAFDALAIVPFASLRMEHKARQFATLKFVNIIVNVVMNIVLLVTLHAGIEGIFISSLTASVVTFLLLLPTVYRHLGGRFNPALFRSLLKFGLPSIPAGLSATAVQVIDRPILRALTNDATVGIYQANYRLGIFMMLIVSVYDYAWRPFYFSTAKDPNAKEVFARTLTYLVLLMAGVFLVLTFFIGDIVKVSFFGRHIISPAYWSGLSIVPIVLMGYIFLGIYTNLSAGIYIEKKTHYLPLITFLSALVNVVANYLLIPPMGMMGAAWATFLAYFVMAVAGYVIAQRVYPIQYEIGRVVKIAVSGAAVMLIYIVAPVSPNLLGTLFKFALLGVFLVAVYAMKFFDSREINALKGLIQRTGSEGTPATSLDPPIREP